MRISYAARQAVLAGLAANAIRPLGGYFGSVPAFAFGWLTSELAPQLLAVSAADTAAELAWRRRHGRGSAAGLALGLASAGALGYLVYAARKTPAHMEAVLAESLGPDYADRLDPTLAVDLAVSLAEITHPFRLRDHETVKVHRNVSYVEGGGRRAGLDIYVPRDVELKDAPVLIQVHGGGWTVGAKEEQGLILMHRMARRGWVCVSVNYRLAPKDPWPTQIVDVKRAIAWVREHIAVYGGDPSYLTITGGSAGGHLTALAALTPDWRRSSPASRTPTPRWPRASRSTASTTWAGSPSTGTPSRCAIVSWRHGCSRRTGRAPRGLRGRLTDRARAQGRARLLRHPRRQRHPGVGATRRGRSSKRCAEKIDATVTYAELPGTQHAFEVFSSIRSQHVIRAVQRWLEWHRASWLLEHRPDLPVD